MAAASYHNRYQLTMNELLMKKVILSARARMVTTSAPTATPPILTPDAKLALGDFAVNLTQKRQVEGYPVQPEFTRIMKEKFIASLKARNLLAEPTADSVMTVSIQIDYRRIFTGEDTPIVSKSAISPEVRYTLVVSEHGIEKKRIAESRLRRDRGFLGNLKGMATLGFGRTPEDELKDIEVFADYLANKIESLKK